MPTYICEKCGCLENSALGHYWGARIDGKPVICSECHTGKWHGRFEKRFPEKKKETHNDPTR